MTGATFEDLQIALDTSGGWCSRCDGPAKLERPSEPEPRPARNSS